jgi:hypothetical protein
MTFQGRGGCTSTYQDSPTPFDRVREDKDICLEATFRDNCISSEFTSVQWFPTPTFSQALTSLFQVFNTRIDKSSALLYLPSLYHYTDNTHSSKLE